VADIKLFRAAVVEHGSQPVTIGWKLTIVRRFYEAGRSSGLRQDNPVAGVRPPRVRRAADDFKYLTADQLVRLLAARGLARGRCPHAHSRAEPLSRSV